MQLLTEKSCYRQQPLVTMSGLNASSGLKESIFRMTGAAAVIDLSEKKGKKSREEAYSNSKTTTTKKNCKVDSAAASTQTEAKLTLS